MTIENTGLDSLSPSCKLIHRVLVDEEPLSVSELVQETGLAPRTVQRSLETLEDAGIVRRRPSVDDARETTVVFTGK
jgi:DNA-binding MarR family transcriptional regulator